MERLKEDARKNFIEMIANAWTVDKMTGKEWENLLDFYHSPQTERALKGNYVQRWEILQAIFTSYLIGLGYNGAEWREERPTIKKYFVREVL